MKNKEEEIDNLIHEALTAEESEFYDQLEEPTLMRQALQLYTGRHRFFSIMVTVVMLLYMAFGIFCAVKFFNATEMKSLIMWSGGFFLSIGAILGMKIWSWMQIDKNAIMREIKRLELQISVLAKRSSPTA